MGGARDLNFESPFRHHGGLFIDDVDLFVLKSYLDTEGSLFVEAQAPVQTWGTSLLKTGGIRKPNKCHYYMWGHKCREGEWEQANLINHNPLEVPLAREEKEEIAQLPVSRSEKKLGLYASPLGNRDKQMNVMADNLQMCATRLTASKPPFK